MLEQHFESALAPIPSGYGEGVYEGLQYGVTVRKSHDGKRTSLFVRALAGGDVVSLSRTSTCCPALIAGVLATTSTRSRLAHGVFEALRRDGKRVIAKCPFMSSYAARRPEYRALLDG